MAKSPMQNIWKDKRREDERLKKVIMKKKADGTIGTKPDSSETDSTSEQKEENT